MEEQSLNARHRRLCEHGRRAGASEFWAPVGVVFILFPVSGWTPSFLLLPLIAEPCGFSAIFDFCFPLCSSPSRSFPPPSPLLFSSFQMSSDYLYSILCWPRRALNPPLRSRRFPPLRRSLLRRAVIIQGFIPFLFLLFLSP